MSFMDDINRFKRVYNRTQRVIQPVIDRQQEKQEQREHEARTQAAYNQLPTYAKQQKPPPTQQYLKPPSTAANLFYAALINIGVLIILWSTGHPILALLSLLFYSLTCYIVRKIRDNAFETKVILSNTTQSTATMSRPKSALGDLVPYDELPPEYQQPEYEQSTTLTDRQRDVLGDLVPRDDTSTSHDSNNTIDPFDLDVDDRCRHTYLIGKTGSGKTTTLKHLILTDILEQHGVVVISPERGIFDDLLSYLPPSDYDNLIYFDPTDNKEPIIGFNPFHFDAPDDPHERQQLLIMQAGETYTVFERAIGDLGVTQKTALRNAIRALLQYPDSTLYEFEKLLDPDDTTFRRAIADCEAVDQRTRRFWQRYDENDRSYYNTVYDTLMNRFDLLFQEPLIDILTTNSVTLHEQLNHNPGRILCCDLSGLRAEEARMIGQLLIAHLQQTFFRRDRLPKAQYHPYFCYIDEFQTYASQNENSMRDLLNRTRKYNIGWTLAHQVTADLSSTLCSIIVGNVGTLACMQLAKEDAAYFAGELQMHDYKINSDYELQRGRLVDELLINQEPGEVYIRTPKTDTMHVTVPPRIEDSVGWERQPTPITEIKQHSKERYGAARYTPDEAPPPMAPVDDPFKFEDEEEDGGIDLR